ncbi:MAG: hypothetical protein HY810_10640 [Candidatus Omnitrophica bacterium]|nr:hypothetical protein [Candidatus Omnitrophota bacterium]
MADKFVYFSKQRILIGLVFAACIFIIPGMSSALQKISLLDVKKQELILPAEYFEFIHGGFKGAFADGFYIKGILSLTDKFENSLERLEIVQNNFACALTMDHNLIQAYFFAGIVLGRTEEGINKNIDFLKKYKKFNLKEWRIPYWIGYNYYQKGAYLEAAKYYNEAAFLPGAPDYLKSNQIMLYYNANRAVSGIVYLKGLLISVKDKKQLEWVKVKLEWLEGINLLEQKAGEFKEFFGRYPDSLEELVEKKLLLQIPDDPFGTGYYWDADKAAVRSRFNFSGY